MTANREFRVEQLDSEIQGFNAQIEDRRGDEPAALASLQRRVAALSTERNAHASPLLRLHPEILGHILQFCQCGGPEAQRVQIAKFVYTPWILLDVRWARYTLVCQRLRDVALSTPSLWAFTLCGFDAPQEQLELWTERARGHPLTVIGPSFIDYKAVEAVYSTARKYLPRAHKMQLTAPQHYGRVDQAKLDSAILCTLEDPMPAMRSLNLTLNRSVRLPQLSGGSSSTLTHLTLREVYLDDSKAAPAFPTLRYLNLYLRETNEQGRQLISLVAQAPEIETFIVYAGHFIPTLSASSRCVLLPRLVTLYLRGCLEFVLALTRLLSQPSLRLYVNPVTYNADRTYDRATVNELHRVVSDFWKSATDEDTLPTTEIEWWEDAGSLVFGADFETKAPATHPRVFLRAPAGSIAGLHPYAPLCSFERAAFISSMLSRPMRPINWAEGLRLHELCPAVRYVVIGEMPSTERLHAEFAAWVRERAVAGRPLDTIELHDCAPEVNRLVQALKEDGIVRSVLYASNRFGNGY